MKLGSGSSEYFVITGVFFPDREEAKKCDETISRLRSEMDLRRDRGEFHFSKLNDRAREQFLRGVSHHKFSYSSFILDKRSVSRNGFKGTHSCYQYSVRLLLENLAPHPNQTTVVLDRCGNRHFGGQLKRYLRQHGANAGNPKTIKKVKTEDSHSNNLIQLADMICGAVYKSHASERPDSGRFKRLVEHNELQICVWPSSTS